MRQGSDIVGRKFVLYALIGIVLMFSGCSASQPKAAADSETNRNQAAQTTATAVNQEEKVMKLSIGEKLVPVTWENNSSVADLKEHLPLTIQMSKYGGFEQVGSIGRNIVSDDKEITTHYGDIVLYASNKIVIFCGSNSWAYTRLGHINLSQQEMTELLSKDDVKIVLSEE